ncbi:hypothetical protein G9A89_017614 [Geosiphon pyriformis]|nr:hypothetical protein G9A89_017614 [Geosiphon pyriformis]
MSPQQYFHALSNDFGNLFDSQKFSDIRIIVGEAPNIRTFHAHSQILAARSPYFAKLQVFCTEIAANNPAIVFDSQDFTSLSEKALVSILTQDDLNIEESEIWEKIVEWGIAKLDNNIQTKKVPYWTDENFNAFKESIERLLPLIRFFHISSVDFYHKVKPFARILPGTLYEDLLHHYLVPGSHQKSVDAQPLRSNVDSKLLQSHNIKQLNHWIQGKNKNTPFESKLGNDFKLLLRGSRDGFTPADFHRLCDDKGATISVIKVKGTGQIIGGFNPQSWHSRGEFLNGERSFIFSLGDDNAENAILSKFVTGYGPFDGPNYGPFFGDRNMILSGKDFKNSSGCYCRNTTNYEHAIMPGLEYQHLNFSVEEYEIGRHNRDAQMSSYSDVEQFGKDFYKLDEDSPWYEV